MLTSAKLEISLDIEVGGEYTPADPSVGLGDQYDAGPIIGLTFTHGKFIPIVDDSGSETGYDWQPTEIVDLLAGVDVTNPEVRKLLFNIQALYQTEADEALREANS